MQAGLRVALANGERYVMRPCGYNALKVFNAESAVRLILPRRYKLSAAAKRMETMPGVSRGRCAWRNGQDQGSEK